MDVMFWIWLAVIVLSAIVELATMEVVSIWFTFGAVVPFILAATRAVSWEWQLVIFVCVSAILIVGLREITKKFLMRNSNEKTNLDALVGKKYRMISRTDFETIGSVKINDVVWSAVGENQQTIEAGEIVEIVKISGNKLIVKKAEERTDKAQASAPKPRANKKAQEEAEAESEEREKVTRSAKERKTNMPKVTEKMATNARKKEEKPTTTSSNKNANSASNSSKKNGQAASTSSGKSAPSKKASKTSNKK